MEIELAQRAFREIKESFPSFDMVDNDETNNGFFEITIPKQSGLDFEVRLNIQNNDELHLVASAFWMEWFPCTEPEKVSEYKEAVIGLLSGKWRIVEYLSSGKPVKAELQRPNEQRWVTVATWSKLHMPTFKKHESHIVQNTACS